MEEPYRPNQELGVTNPYTRNQRKIHIGIHPDVLMQAKHMLGGFEMDLASRDYVGAIEYFAWILEMIIQYDKINAKQGKDEPTLDPQICADFKYYFNRSSEREIRTCGYIDGETNNPLPSLTDIIAVRKVKKEDSYGNKYVDEVIIPGFICIRKPTDPEDGSKEKVIHPPDKIDVLSHSEWVQTMHIIVYEKLCPIVSQVKVELMVKIKEESSGPYTSEDENIGGELGDDL